MFIPLKDNRTMDRLETVACRLRSEPLTQDLALETLEAIHETVLELRRLHSLPGIIAQALLDAADAPRANRRGLMDL